VNISKEECHELFKEYDTNENGLIDFEEFKFLVEKKLAKDILVFDDIITEIKEQF
jgi:Ca2+-binding EF-hand superfamily protein